MSYRPEIKSDANGTTQDLPIDAETVQGKTPVFTTTNQTISGVKTYNGNQIFKGYLDIRGTAAEKHLKTRGIGGSDGNGNESDLYLQYNSNYSTKFGKSGNGSLNSDGTITEAGTLLSNKYASKSHNHNSDYVSNVAMAPSSSGSRWVSGIPGNLSADYGDGPVYPVSGTTNIGVGLDEKNITITPGEGAKKAIGSYNSSTGDYSWTLHGKAGSTKANGRIKWTSGDNQLKVTKDGTTSTIGYFNNINGESVISANGSKNFNFYTKTETDNKLSGKSNVGHSHESVKSVIDYGNTSDIIKIGYRGNGLTASQIEYIAGYTTGDNANEHKIKDISKDVLKNWLGYAEVSTGMFSYGSTWTGTPGYVWIIYPYDESANTFKFTYGSGDRTGYGFAILQGEGCIRYFSSATQLTRYSTSTITFSTQMRYIKFKM